jgi:hypothetical protein
VLLPRFPAQEWRAPPRFWRMEELQELIPQWPPEMRDCLLAGQREQPQQQTQEQPQEQLRRSRAQRIPLRRRMQLPRRARRFQRLPRRFQISGRSSEKRRLRPQPQPRQTPPPRLHAFLRGRGQCSPPLLRRECNLWFHKLQVAPQRLPPPHALLEPKLPLRQTSRLGRQQRRKLWDNLPHALQLLPLPAQSRQQHKRQRRPPTLRKLQLRHLRQT